MLEVLEVSPSNIERSTSDNCCTGASPTVGGPSQPHLPLHKTHLKGSLSRKHTNKTTKIVAELAN